MAVDGHARVLAGIATLSVVDDQLSQSVRVFSLVPANSVEINLGTFI